MATRERRGFWRTCRIYFRRFRMVLWLVILALLGALLYLNQVGLPGFLKRPLLESLRSRGLDLEFSRLRLNWHRGIVAENVRFGRADVPMSPQFTASQVQLRLNYRALARLHFQIDALVLRQGRLTWPLAETNQAPRQLTVQDIQSELRFLPGDEWSLEQFTAGFAGANIQLSGTVAHASAVRQWKFLQAREAAKAGVWRERLRALEEALERIHFSQPPKLRLDVRGDARELSSFGVRLLVNTPGADTPWGTVRRGWLGARLFAADTNGLSSAEVTLEAGEARTRWATVDNVQISAHLASFESLTKLGNGNLTLSAGRLQSEWGRASDLHLALHGAAMEGQTNLISANLWLRAGDVQNKWGSASNAQFQARWTHALTNAFPLDGEGKLRCSQVKTKWGAARELRFGLRLPAPPAPARADASWAWWGRLEPYALDWDGQATGLQAHGIKVQESAFAGSWRAPVLTITNLHAQLDQRHLDLRANVDVATRALSLGVNSGVDPHSVAPLLSENARHWLAAVSWEQPPQFNAEASLVLPPWTNRPPTWLADLLPTLRLQGDFKLERGGSYKGLAISAAQSHVSWSNMVLRLPDLSITRPEGRLQAVHEADLRSKDFYFHISSTLDVLAVRPLLEPPAQHALDYFTFSEPPVIDAELWGRLHQPERLGLKGRVALTNFTFRGESFSSLQTPVQYTNRFLRFSGPHVRRGPQSMSADGLGVDLAAQLIYLTNGYSTADPMVVARVIGPHIVRAVEPYKFAQPPHAHVHGTIPMHGEAEADLHFALDGGPFEWWHFRVPYIVGNVHWLGEHLSLTNMWLNFYGGQAVGDAQFDFNSGEETDYQFNIAMTGALLHPLVEDLFLKTNRLEGRLNGTLIVSRANTATIRSWVGNGDVALRDGLIWDIPIFGIFSDVLNKMKPGLGSSRASAGSGTFGITNGVIRTDDMEIRSTAMRLLYRGTLDFDGQVNARVQAEPLRDTWLVGPLLSYTLWPVTKLFEYKVTGALGDPKAVPIHLLPKMMWLPFQMPFHPWRSLRGLFPEDSNSSRTNAPPPQPPK
jgi:AsmA-like C-terminal region